MSKRTTIPGDHTQPMTDLVLLEDGTLLVHQSSMDAYDDMLLTNTIQLDAESVRWMVRFLDGLRKDGLDPETC